MRGDADAVRARRDVGMQRRILLVWDSTVSAQGAGPVASATQVPAKVRCFGSFRTLEQVAAIAFGGS